MFPRPPPFFGCIPDRFRYIQPQTWLTFGHFHHTWLCLPHQIWPCSLPLDLTRHNLPHSETIQAHILVLLLWAHTRHIPGTHLANTWLTFWNILTQTWSFHFNHPHPRLQVPLAPSNASTSSPLVPRVQAPTSQRPHTVIPSPSLADQVCFLQSIHAISLATIEHSLQPCRSKLTLASKKWDCLHFPLGSLC